MRCRRMMFPASIWIKSNEPDHTRSTTLLFSPKIKDFGGFLFF